MKMTSEQLTDLNQLAKRTCIIVLNWNRYQDTIECLDSLLASAVPPRTIVVCDNGSEDHSVDHLRSWAEIHYSQPDILTLHRSELEQPRSFRSCPAFVLVLNGANLGYGGGNNTGIRFALSQSAYDFIWILNNDTVVDPQALPALLASVSRRFHVGIFGSTVAFFHQPERIQCAGGCRFYPLSTVYHPAYEGAHLSELHHIPVDLRLDYVYGASMFIRREVFDRIGLFNEDYFLFYEELDLCGRAKRAGFGLGWCRASIVYHKESKTIGRPGTAGDSKIAWANYFENLSTLLFLNNFHPRILPLAMVLRFLGKCSVIVARRHWYLLKPLLAAYRDFLRHFRNGHRSPRSSYNGQ